MLDTFASIGGTGFNFPESTLSDILCNQQKEARARVAAGETQRSVVRSHNVNQSTISRL
jgi:hypothetical protein